MEDQKNLISKYSFTKRDIYYFSRRVPEDLQRQYKRARIVTSLKTKDAKEATAAIKLINNQLEQLWFQLRTQALTSNYSGLMFEESVHKLTIDEALDYYIKHKGTGRSSLFYKHARHYVSYLKKALTNKRKLKDYTHRDAIIFRDWLKDKGLSNGSIHKSFATIRAIMNFVIQEQGLEIKNVFKDIQLPSEKIDCKKRIPLLVEDIIKIQRECKNINDDIRWLVALISDTGMRLSEAVGLKISDLCLNEDTPYMIVQPHSHRPLKTLDSKRIIPLVGASLWAAKMVISNNKNSEYCFPRYCKNHSCNSNSASAALNKWIKNITKKDYVIHGFRHSFRDRLRAVGTQSEMIDQLGGWSLKSVGQKYGSGYDLEQLYQKISLIIVKSESEYRVLNLIIK